MGDAHLKTDDTEGGFLDELSPGTELLQGQYKIEKFLNSGGFGITYLASNSLDRTVVIKECFPSSVCHRSRAIVKARSRTEAIELGSVVKLFVQEARRLSKLDHPNIVGVHEVFEENETAYMVLDLVEGRDLLDTLEDPNHGLTPPQIKAILQKVLSAVQFIHDQDILHRDISPDNILIDANLRPVLIDFGAAREEATKKSRALSAMRVVKDGYSPQEFYIQGSDQTPSSDLYALSATFYHLIVGDIPPNSQARLAALAAGETDPYQPLVGRIEGYDDHFLAAMDAALGILPKDRIQSASEWLTFMEDGKRELGVNLSYTPNVRPVKVAAAPKKRLHRLTLVGTVAILALSGLIVSGTLPKLGTLSAHSVAGSPPQSIEAALNGNSQNNGVAPAPVVAELSAVVEQPDTSIVELNSAPFKRTFSLNTGDEFESVQADGAWKTIATVVVNPDSQLKAGDHIIAFLPSNEKLTDDASLQTILSRERATGMDQFTFAVSRNGSMLIASMTFDQDT